MQGYVLAPELHRPAESPILLRCLAVMTAFAERLPVALIPEQRSVALVGYHVINNSRSAYPARTSTTGRAHTQRVLLQVQARCFAPRSRVPTLSRGGPVLLTVSTCGTYQGTWYGPVYGGPVRHSYLVPRVTQGPSTRDGPFPGMAELRGVVVPWCCTKRRCSSLCDLYDRVAPLVNGRHQARIESDLGAQQERPVLDAL